MILLNCSVRGALLRALSLFANNVWARAAASRAPVVLLLPRAWIILKPLTPRACPYFLFFDACFPFAFRLFSWEGFSTARAQNMQAVAGRLLRRAAVFLFLRALACNAIACPRTHSLRCGGRGGWRGDTSFSCSYRIQ
jgi:hypothetical protein